MSTDEDDTDRWWRKPRRVQTSDDRALAAMRGKSSSPGIPLPREGAGDDTTDPFTLFEPERRRARRESDSVAELATTLRQRAPDPYDLIAAMAFELIAAKRDTKSQSEELDAQLKKFLAIQPGGERFEELAKAVAELAPVRGGMKWLARSFVATAVAIGLWLYARGGKETAIDMRIEQLRLDVAKLQRQLETRPEPHL